jgi:hypothetical protein
MVIVAPQIILDDKKMKALFLAALRITCLGLHFLEKD